MGGDNEDNVVVLRLAPPWQLEAREDLNYTILGCIVNRYVWCQSLLLVLQRRDQKKCWQSATDWSPTLLTLRLFGCAGRILPPGMAFYTLLLLLLKQWTHCMKRRVYGPLVYGQKIWRESNIEIFCKLLENLNVSKIIIARGPCWLFTDFHFLIWSSRPIYQLRGAGACQCAVIYSSHISILVRLVNQCRVKLIDYSCRGKQTLLQRFLHRFNQSEANLRNDQSRRWRLWRWRPCGRL